MSWSIEEHIGEGRPWPEQVVVYRGETDESLTYARRSLSDVNKMVELMDTLAAENAKLRELVGAGTCEADETDLIPFVRADSGDFEVDYIHIMECTECGHTYEHVNGDYEFCPRCGRKREDVSE